MGIHVEVAFDVNPCRADERAMVEGLLGQLTTERLVLLDAEPLRSHIVSSPGQMIPPPPDSTSTASRKCAVALERLVVLPAATPSCRTFIVNEWA
jgi:hypothetical protein